MRTRSVLIFGPLLLSGAAVAVLWPDSLGSLLNPWYLACYAFYVAAVVLLIKAPGHRVGALMMAFPALTSLSILAFSIASVESGDRAAWADCLGNAFATAALMSIPLLLLHFPDGRLPSERWRAGRILIIVSAVVGFVAAVLNGGWGGEPEVGSLESPIREATAPLGDILSSLFFAAMLVSFVVAGVSVVRRFVRADMAERSQIKWVALASAFCVVALVVGLVASASDTWGELILVGALMTVPTAIAIAVLRYRLYDIDRLVSRTVGYALVLAVISVVYVVLAVWLPTWRLGEQTPTFVAASTLAIAAAFRPLRHRVLGWVDRRFYRARYDAERVQEAFAAGVRDRIDISDLSDDLVEVVTSTLQPATIGIWVK